MIINYILHFEYGDFAEKGEKNGIIFVKMHKNHSQNRNQMV